MADTILIIEDSMVVQAQLRDILQDRYRLVIENSGATGIAAALAESPALILLDINLPGMDGYQVCHVLKREHSTCDIPIVFLTAYGAGNEKVKGFEAGADDYVVKPFYPDELLARIKLHLASRRAKQMAVELERLNLLREMAVALSHEINNPLTAILGYLHLSEKDLPEGSEAAQGHLAQVRKELERIKAIVARLANASKDAKTGYVLDEEMIDLEKI